MRYEMQAAQTLLGKLDAVPASMSAWTAQAEDYVQEWALAYGLVRSMDAQARFRKTAPGALSGRVYASAVDQGRLEAATAWIGWLFFIDDQLDEGDVGKNPLLVKERLRPFVAMAAEMEGTATAGCGEGVVETGSEQSSRSQLLVALKDVWQQFLPGMPAHWRAAFAKHYVDYLSGCEWEARNRAHGYIPREHEFAAMRRDAGAIWPSLDLLEYVADAPLPDKLRSHPLLVEIRTACADAVCWTDDLLTVAKERAHGDVHNLVMVLEHALECDERHAMDMVAQRIATRVEDLQKLRRAMGAINMDERAKVAFDRHLAGLYHWIRGHLEWGLQTIRYDAYAVESVDYLEDLLGATH